MGAVRVRLVSGHGWADLRGATTCAAITEAEARAVLARLGPDPLRNRPGDRDASCRAVLARQTPLAALLMDQKVIAGVGNVYRAEVLFRQRLDPWLPGHALSRGRRRTVWDDTAAVMSDGVRDGRIITTPAAYWGRQAAAPAGAGGRRRTYVYKREGLPCRVCARPVAHRRNWLAASCTGARGCQQ